MGLDKDTRTILTTFGLDLLLGLGIFLGWNIFRKCRGDSKKNSQSEELPTEYLLSSTEIDEKNLDLTIENELNKQYSQQISAEWRKSFRDFEILQKTDLDGNNQLNLEVAKDEESRKEEESKDDHIIGGGNDSLNHHMVTFQTNQERETILSKDPNEIDITQDGGEKTEVDINDNEDKDEKEFKAKALKNQIMKKFNIIKRVMKTDYIKPKGLIDWYKIIRNISDVELKEVCGMDLALYLIFIRLAAIYFTVLTVLNLVTFIPIYATGDPAKPEDVQDSNGNLSYVALITALNITGTGWKCQLAYSFMTFFYTIFCYALIYQFWKKSISWKYQKHSHLKKFREIDIAKHTIIINGLPESVSASEMSKKLKQIFEKLYGEDQVISARVQIRCDELYDKVKKLIKIKKDLDYCISQIENLKNKEPQQATKMQRIFCCKKYRLDYIEQKKQLEKDLQKTYRDVSDLQLKEARKNCGIGIITFMSNLQVQQAIYRQEFEQKVNQLMSKDEIGQFLPYQWTIKQAPTYSDIIWENIYVSDGVNVIKSWFLLVLLFVICIMVVTPVTLLDNLNSIVEFFNKQFGDGNIVSDLLATYSSTLALLAFNSGILPLLIDIIAFLEQHKTKSQKCLSVMRKQFFFQTMTTIFLQLTAQGTLGAFLETSLEYKDIQAYIQYLAQKLVSNDYFFLRYLIQLTFISNGILLLDIPHYLKRRLNFWLYQRQAKKEKNPKPFVDDCEYDISYQQAQALVIFSLGIIFTGTMPLMAPMACLYFTIRYFIDKYNLMFVYNKQFEGYGRIKNQALIYIIVSMYFFQLLNLGFFSSLSYDFYYGGGIFIIAQTVALIAVKAYYQQKKEKARKNIVKLEHKEKCDNLEDYENSIIKQTEAKSSLESRKPSIIMQRIKQFIDENNMDAPGRRITIENEHFMSDYNIKKLQNAYRHPFEKIPLKQYKKIQIRKSSGINDADDNDN